MFMSAHILYFFVFKQKTAYEMRISDWSSDVCSSDLRIFHVGIIVAIAGRIDIVEGERRFHRNIGLRFGDAAQQIDRARVGQPLFEPARNLIAFGLALARIAFVAEIRLIGVEDEEVVVAVERGVRQYRKSVEWGK